MISKEIIVPFSILVCLIFSVFELGQNGHARSQCLDNEILICANELILFNFFSIILFVTFDINYC